MKNVLRPVLVMLVLAVLPLRVPASAAAAFCFDGGHGAAAPVHGHAAAGAEHHDTAASGNALDHDCGFCAKHCSGTACALVAGALCITAVAPADPIPFAALPTVGFFPEHPERPPLSPSSR